MIYVDHNATSHRPRHEMSPPSQALYGQEILLSDERPNWIVHNKNLQILKKSKKMDTFFNVRQN